MEIDAWSLVTWLLMGLVAGVIARLLVKGRNNLGLIGTAVLGVLGSLVGGTLYNAVFNDGFDIAPSGFFGSIAGAVIILVVARLLSGDGRRSQAPSQR